MIRIPRFDPDADAMNVSELELVLTAGREALDPANNYPPETVASWKKALSLWEEATGRKDFAEAGLTQDQLKKKLIRYYTPQDIPEE